FSPIQALKGKLKLGKGGAAFRHALVVVQFSISILLIVGTSIITRQMSYVKNKQLGYDKEQTLLVRIDNNDIYNHMQAFKTDLQNSGAVKSVSLMSASPAAFSIRNPLMWRGTMIYGTPTPNMPIFNTCRHLASTSSPGGIFPLNSPVIPCNLYCLTTPQLPSWAGRRSRPSANG